MPDDAFHRLYLVDGRWLCNFLEPEKVADEDRLLLLVHHRRPFLEFLVRAKPCGNLQVGNRVGMPCV